MRLEITKAEGKTKATALDAAEAMNALRRFINGKQLSVLAKNCRGEEKQFFFDMLVQKAALVATMPKTYEQDGKGDAAIVYLHYFTGGCDWHITERDSTEQQHQAFGLADLRLGEPELGYISIEELLQNGAELDLYWTPCTLGEVKAQKDKR